jgi:predicted nucleic acid-binding protein
MIVVDTNLIGALFLQSARSEQAEQALLKDPHWAAPLLWRSELCNVLTKYVRKGLLSLADALQILEKAIELMQDGEYQVNALQVLGLAAKSKCSAYDCEFVALAQALEIRLVTLDRQILSQFPALTISLEDFVTPPQ